MRAPPANDPTVQRRCGLALVLLVVAAAAAPTGGVAFAAGTRGPPPAPPLHPMPPTLRLPARIGPLAVDLPILMYHRIDRITPGLPWMTRALTVTPGVFRGQMAWIAAHGYHTVTQMQVWNALMHRRPLPTRPVMVTFDDAYRDVVTYAGPVIRRYHQHATAYVITDRLSHGRVTPWMTWRQLRVLQHDGFDIGSHTVSHVDLVRKLERTGALPAARLAIRARTVPAPPRAMARLPLREGRPCGGGARATGGIRAGSDDAERHRAAR